MNLRETIHRELEAIAREARPAAEKLGLSARGTVKAAGDELDYLVEKEQVGLAQPNEWASLVRYPVRARMLCLFSLSLLLDTSPRRACEYESLDEWITDIERAQAAIKRYLPKAAPAPDRAEFATWQKRHGLRAQARELEQRAEGLKDSVRA